jgi:hypothetical protein
METYYGRVEMCLVTDDDLLDCLDYPKDYEGYMFIPWEVLRANGMESTAETRDEYRWVPWPESQDYMGYKDEVILLVPDDTGVVQSSEYMVPKDLDPYPYYESDEDESNESPN